MIHLSTLGKYLDQPILVSKFSNAVPKVLATGAILYGLNNIKSTPKEERKKSIIKNISVLGFTVASALISTRGIKPIIFFKKQIFKGFNGLSNLKEVKEVQKQQTEIIDSFLKETKVSSTIEGILTKAKEKILSIKELNTLTKESKTNTLLTKLIKDIIPEPQNVSSKEIFGEIGRLSLIGLIPVLGGITGGVVGDSLTEKDWKTKVPNKIKEGAYQYLANIFLCNIGAGAALGIMEKLKVKSKAQKALAMVAGIILTGVIGGSFMANIISKKLIDPLLKQEKEDDNIYSERHPEALDIGLHVDDIATVAVMSGLRWIEPALPILYSISGYRAGIGYRNGEKESKHSLHRHLASYIYQKEEKPDVFQLAFGSKYKN